MNKKQTNVLIYPCGPDTAIEIYEAIKHSLDINVMGANSIPSAANSIYEHPIVHLPNISAKNFIDTLNKIIEEHDIDLIFPTHDDVLYYLAANTAEIDTIIIGADEYINHISRYKKNTYALFKKLDFCPTVYNKVEEINSFPVFLKPDRGRGSIGARLIKCKEQLLDEEWKENVITEFLPGKEYTVDCFSDAEHALLYAFPRERKIITNGVSCLNVEPNEVIQKRVWAIASKINQELKFKGLWFFQLKEDQHGTLKLLEICPRIASTMAFARYKGVNLPLLTVYAYLNWDLKVAITHDNVELYRYSQTKAKYDFSFKNVYINYENTLVANGKINVDMIGFIYQCLNDNLKVYLITHQSDVKEVLAQNHVSETLFTKIICVPDKEPIQKHITEPKAIFIDSAYKERMKVFKHGNIPVFDVEGVKPLIKSY